MLDEIVVRLDFSIQPAFQVRDRFAFETDDPRGPFVVYRRFVDENVARRLLELQRADVDEDTTWIPSDLEQDVPLAVDNGTLFSEEILSLLYPLRHPEWDEAIRQGSPWTGCRVITETEPYSETVFMVSPRPGSHMSAVVSGMRRVIEADGGTFPEFFCSFDSHMSYPTIAAPIFRSTHEGITPSKYAELVGIA